MCALRAETPFAFVLTTGDNFYPSGTARRDTWTVPERCLHDVPWRASWGNHDVPGRSTAELLRSPKRATWSEAGIDFFVVDSNRASDEEQRRWLEAGLARSRARVRIVAFHHPPYTAGLHAPDERVRRAWVPLFERYRVTLVLAGHNHLYEHLVVRGVHYVVTGGGGATITPCARPARGLRRCAAAHHFLLVTVTADELIVRAIRASGETLDGFEIPL